MRHLFTKTRVILGSVLLATIVAIGGFFITRAPRTAYQYAVAGPHFLAEQTRASGKITTAQDISLSFDRSGRIGAVPAAVGTTVKAGEVLVALDNGIESSQLAQAQAALNQRLAGATPAEIAVAKAAADAVQADLEKTKVDTDNAVAAAQAALDTAQNNLKQANSGDNSQIVTQAYQSEIASLQAALPKIDDGLTQANNILDFGNPSGSPTGNQYIKHLGILDQSTVTKADDLYQTVKNVRATTMDRVNTLVVDDQAGINQATTAVLSELANEQLLLEAVSGALGATLTDDTQSQAFLDAKKTVISTARSGLSTTYSAVLAQTQAVVNAKNSLTTYTIAFQKAERDLAAATADRTSAIATKQALYEQALSNVTFKTQAPRDVDVAGLKASIAGAAANYHKTLLISPFDGTVSRQDAKVGASVSPGTPLVSIIDESRYQLVLYVSEAAISTLKPGDTAAVTLDAYGNNIVFPATIVSTEPAASTGEGTTGYKITLQFNQPDPRLKVDMTGNATITTATTTAAMAIPASSVIQKNNQYLVLLDSSQGTPREQIVTVGLKSADGWWEITSGLSPGARVVTF